MTILLAARRAARHGHAGLALLLAAPFLLAAQTGAPMTKHATGTFEVTITPESQAPAPAGGVATARMGLSKRFSGGLEGTATGTMLSAGMPAPGASATYVAIDQFHGTLEGRQGGFVLAHRGTMTKAGGAALTILVSPDSGTGALEGIAGSLSIELRDGRHFYDLAYTLPDRP